VRITDALKKHNIWRVIQRKSTKRERGRREKRPMCRQNMFYSFS
jgi:hypothetical protein